MGSDLNEYLPFGVLLLTLLSVDMNRPSIRNFITAVVGAVVAFLSPTNSHWGLTISFGLMIFAFALSPLMSLAGSAACTGIAALHYWVQKRSLKDQNPAGIAPTTEAAEPGRCLINPRRIRTLHQPTTPEDATVDIVAVHGLGSSVETTWTHATSKKLWLRDFLPDALPKARIMTYRHNSSWMSNATLNDLEDYGLQLLSALKTMRREGEGGIPNRPLVLIGHSFGGLLIEQALVLAKRKADDNTEATDPNSLVNNIAGIIFLGTPHAGSAYSLFGKLYCLFHYWDGASTTLLSYLDSGSINTHKLEDEFCSRYKKVAVVDYYERLPNRVFGLYLDPVVDKLSATRTGYDRFPLDTDHFGLNKFESDEDQSYLEVKAMIVDMVSKGINPDQIGLKDQNENECGRILEKDILDALYFSNIDDRESKIEDRYPQNCSWILDEKSPIVPWFHNQETFFWVSGKAGCGKSTLMKYMYRNSQAKDELSQWADGKDLILAGYFFYDRGSEDQKSREGMLRSILYQVLKDRPSLIPKVFSKLHGHISPLPDNFKTWISLCTAFQSMLANLEGSKICLFLDGLDEYRMLDRINEYTEEQLDFIYDGNEDDNWGRNDWITEGHREVARFLHQFNNRANLKLCISSREVNVFVDEFRNFPRLRVHEHTAESIAQYCKDRLEKEASSLMDKSEYVSIITTASSGVFLWVRIVIGILIAGNTRGKYKHELMKSLSGLPPRLGGDDGLYMHMMQAVDKNDLDESKRLFQLVMAWPRQTGTLDIVSLFLSEPGHLDIDREEQLIARNDEILLKSWSELDQDLQLYERRLKTMCGGLLENTDDVQFMHQTAKEFMSKEYLWKKLFEGIPGFANEADVNLAIMSGVVRRLKCCREACFQSGSQEHPDESGDESEHEDATVGLCEIPKGPGRGYELFRVAIDCASNVLYDESKLSDYSVYAVEILDELDSVYTQLATDWKDALPNLPERSSVANVSWLEFFLKPESRTLSSMTRRYAQPFKSLLEYAAYCSLFPYVEAKIRGKNLPESQLQPLLLRAVRSDRMVIRSEHSSSMVCSASPKVSEILLKEGASPNYPNDSLKATGGSKSSTAWIDLLQSNSEHSYGGFVKAWILTVKIFIKHGADPNVRLSWVDEGELDFRPDKVVYNVLTKCSSPETFEKDREEIIELLRQARDKLGDGVAQERQEAFEPSMPLSVDSETILADQDRLRRLPRVATF